MDQNKSSLQVSELELKDLPPELLKQLSFGKTKTELEKRIFEIIKESEGGEASLDYILIALYRSTGKVFQRTAINNRIYKMQSLQGYPVYSVARGVYSINDPNAPVCETKQPAMA